LEGRYVGDLISRDEREALLAELRGVIDARGAQTFLTAPILEPTARDFPDPFEPNEEGVRTILRRILRYAALDDLEVDLDTFSQPDEMSEIDERGRAKKWGHEGAAAWFAGIEDSRCHFGIAVERIGEPASLVATLCHEVTHAWRHVHGLRDPDRDLEERLTDLSTVYLGFGLLTTNGAYMYRASGELTGGESAGSIAVTRWSHTRGGYLSPESMSFLLAAQVKARGMGWFARRRIAGKLETNQSAYFGWCLGKLPPVDELRELLGLNAAVVQPA
jgi:hypothetical protein